MLNKLQRTILYYLKNIFISSYFNIMKHYADLKKLTNYKMLRDINNTDLNKLGKNT